MKINKQKIFEILITGLISTAIAILQNILANYANHPNLGANIETAGALGLAIKSIRSLC